MQQWKRIKNTNPSEISYRTIFKNPTLIQNKKKFLALAKVKENEARVITFMISKLQYLRVWCWHKDRSIGP